MMFVEEELTRLEANGTSVDMELTRASKIDSFGFGLGTTTLGTTLDCLMRFDVPRMRHSCMPR